MRTVSLLNYTRCSIFDIKSKPYPHCLKYIDQTNCSDIELVGGYCDMYSYHGYTTVTSYHGYTTVTSYHGYTTANQGC